METRKAAAIDPADWLEEHEPEESQRPFSCSNDALRLGADELARCDGDLSRALANRPDCRAEIVLAWLAAQATEDRQAADGIFLAALIVGGLSS